jgi:hypothetical protein
MPRENALKMSSRFIRGVIVAGAVLMTTGTGTGPTLAGAPAHPSAAAVGSAAHLSPEDDLGWQ